MAKRNPVKKKPSLVERVQELDYIDEISDLLCEGSSLVDVAKFIQQTLGELTTTVSGDPLPESSLVKALRTYRQTLEMKPVVYSPAEEAPRLPRTPSTLARGAYMKQSRGIDSLIEMESMYLSIRDRIGWLMEMESDRGGGEAVRPFEKLYLDFQTAGNLIEKHAKLQNELGMTTQDRFKITLDVKGMRSKFGESIATVLSDPESRHKVLSLLDRLKVAGSLPSDVIDVVSTDVPAADVPASDE